MEIQIDLPSVTELQEKWLDEEHSEQIQNFNCTDLDGDDHVQLFLQEQAIQLMHDNLVRTRLFFDKSQNLIGFYSLFNDTIKLHKSKRQQLNISLPQNVREIPAIKLHYRGIDNKFRGLGYGNHIMASVLLNCATVAKISGCTLITLESTKNAIGYYEKYDFKYIHRVGSYYLMAINAKNLLDLV